MSKLKQLLTFAALLSLTCGVVPSIAEAAGQADAARTLTLEQALKIASERSPDITLSALILRAAEAAILAADVTPNPNLSLAATSINPRQGIGPGSLRDKAIDTSVRVEQLIERGGKRELRTRNAALLADASRSELDQVRRQHQVLVSQAFYDLLASQERETIVRDTAGLFESSLAAAEKRKSAGDLSGAEVERLRVDALRARNELRTARTERTRAQLALGLMMGLSTPAELQAAESWPTPAALPAVSDLQTWLATRPSVRATRARLEAAEAALSLAQAARTRDVSVGVQFDRSPASAMNGQYSSNTYGVSVQVPLFANHFFEGEIRQAAAQRESARTELQRQEQIALVELERLREEAASAADRLTRFRSELTISATRSMQAAEFAFRNGAASVTDVLDARRTYRAITLDELNARNDYAKVLSSWIAVTSNDSK